MAASRPARRPKEKVNQNTLVSDPNAGVPLPSLPPHRQGFRHLPALLIGVVLCAFAAMALVAALLIGVLLVRVTGTVGSDTIEPIREIPSEDGTIPDVDSLVAVDPLSIPAPDIDRLFGNGEGSLGSPDGTLIAGTVIHVADAVSLHGNVSWYSWSEWSGADGTQLDCWAVVGATGSTSWCSDVNEPNIGTGQTDGPDGTVFNVAASGLSADAEWLVTSTWGDGLVASRVVDGMSYHEWAPDLKGDSVIADARQVYVLDEDLNLLWSRVIR